MSSTKKIKLKRETPAVDFSLLPDVVMIEIFSYLDYYDLCRCARVCRRWRDLKQCGPLKKSIILSKGLTAVALRKLVQSHFHEGLEVVELRNDPCQFWNHLDDYSIDSSHSFHVSLRRYSQEGTVLSRTIQDMRVRSPYLRKLVFKGCRLCSDFIPNIPTSELRHLGIINCEFRIIATSCLLESHLENLTCLEIVCSFMPKQLQISSLKNLCCLYLQGSYNVDNKFIRSLVNLLPRLHILDVEGIRTISEEGVGIILDHCIAIKELYIGYLNVHDDVLSCRSVLALPNLTTLCVAYTNFTPNGLLEFTRGSKIELNILGLNNIPDVSFQLPYVYPAYKYVRACDHYLSHSCPY